MEATQTATGHVSAATVLAAGQEGAKAMTIAEKLIAATSKKARQGGYFVIGGRNPIRRLGMRCRRRSYGRDLLQHVARGLS